uniref:Alpha-galactosidase n=1 Tax=Panagrellus redivivus TaxID=6233 RepID=A0A7E4VX66_PANRE
MRILSSLILVIANIAAVSSLQNGLARLPPMGWMSWAKFLCETDCKKHPNTCISEDLYAKMGNRLVTDGYKDVGYEYIHIDDCWSKLQRNKEGRLEPDSTRFSKGIPWLVDFLHQRGIKLGIYGDVGPTTCAKYPGSLNHTTIDAETFASWGIDYLKFDGCFLNESGIPAEYKKMSDALIATGKKIVYGCEWPLYLQDHPETINYKDISSACNLWRNFHDIDVNWQSIINTIDWYNEHQDEIAEFHGPGAWNDPDMIVAGNPEITDDQARAQMTLWSIWSAPLIMSNDLRTVTPSAKAILQNRDVIAIDQDQIGDFGKMVFNWTDLYFYVKKVTPVVKVDDATEFSKAIAVLNRGTVNIKINMKLSLLDLKYDAGYSVRDLWAQKDLGLYGVNDELHLHIQPTGVVFLKATLVKKNRTFKWNI